MPIQLITGNPGACKTLYMMQLLTEAAAKAERPIYAAGIDGLAPGYAEDLPDPRKWNEIDPLAPATCHCPASNQVHGHVIPDGALIFVDEAWRWFGHLHDATRQATPKHVLDLAIHRHRGLDFVWTTQLPNQIYPHSRGLIGEHCHMVRVLGTKLSTRYEWPELCEDVKSPTQREKAIQTRWIQRTDLFDKYKSASLHTIKTKIPKRLILLPVGLIAVIALAYVGFNSLFGKAAAENAVGHTPEEARAESGAADSAPASSGKPKPEAPKTAAQWLTAMTPVVPGVPYTAPLYADHLEIQSHPQVFCIIGGADYKDRLGSHCLCRTEQGTVPPEISDTMCRAIAINGYYDPYKPQARTSSQANWGGTATPQAASTVNGTKTPPSQVGPSSGAMGAVW